MDWQAAATTLVVAAAFLQLRILDEIRDAAIDAVGHPERPLPSGLVTEPELRALAVALALVGVVLTVPFGVAELAACSLALITIWALGHGLPRRLALRHGMLGEALLHSVIVPELLLVAWTSVADLDAWAPLGAALLLAWGAGLTIELARKTVRPGEERPGVLTYSRELGRPRAILLGALAISAAWLGAGGLAIASHATTATAVVPLVAAGSIPLLTQRFGERIGTGALRSAAPILVLCLLLWPLVILAGTP
jgi:4-hydroxybenzoate polyprenyltransferase